MSDTASQAADIKHQQRRIFLLGAVAAAVPIICQVLMYCVIKVAPGAFPKSDHNLSEVNFWAIQIMLLSVAVSGGAIVDFNKLIITHQAKKAGVVLQFSVLIVCFIIISILFSVTLLDAQIGWTFVGMILIFALVDLGLAYRVEMDIALVEAGLLN